MTHKAVVIAGNCVSIKQRALLLYEKAFFLWCWVLQAEGS